MRRDQGALRPHTPTRLEHWSKSTQIKSTQIKSTQIKPSWSSIKAKHKVRHEALIYHLSKALNWLFYRQVDHGASREIDGGDIDVPLHSLPLRHAPKLQAALRASGACVRRSGFQDETGTRRGEARRGGTELDQAVNLRLITLRYVIGGTPWKYGTFFHTVFSFVPCASALIYFIFISGNRSIISIWYLKSTQFYPHKYLILKSSLLSS